MDRRFLAGRAILLVAFSAASEVGDLDARCLVRSAGDLAPGCGDQSLPHGRTVFAVSVANSTGTMASVNSVSFVEADDAAEQPDRRYPPLLFVSN